MAVKAKPLLLQVGQWDGNLAEGTAKLKGKDVYSTLQYSGMLDIIFSRIYKL